MLQIRIRVDPDSNCQAGSGSVFGIRIMEVKLSYKNPLFPKKFHDFHWFLKMIQKKSSLFNKIQYLLNWLKTKIKYLLFGLKTKISPKILFLPLDVFASGLEKKNPGSGTVKNESGSETLQVGRSIILGKFKRPTIFARISTGASYFDPFCY